MILALTIAITVLLVISNYLSATGNLHDGRKKFWSGVKRKGWIVIGLSLLVGVASVWIYILSSNVQAENDRQSKRIATYDSIRTESIAVDVSITKKFSDSIIRQNVNLNDEIQYLRIQITEQNKKLAPFITYAEKYHPSVELDEALGLLKSDIEKQNKKQVKTEKKVDSLQNELNATNSQSQAKIEILRWDRQNVKVSSIKYDFQKGNPIDVKEKYNVDFLYGNVFKISYESRIALSSVRLKIHQKDIIYVDITAAMGNFILGRQADPDGSTNLILKTPPNGLYTLVFYTKTMIEKDLSIELIQ